jgi:hypothetical protein
MKHFASLFTACLLAVPANADDAPASSWRVGAPIVTYWAGPGYPGGSAQTDVSARQLAEGGWNLVWCRENELDAVQRQGLRGQLTDPLLSPASLEDPKKREALDAMVARVRRHPALYAYFITDEPAAGLFAGLGKLVAHLRALDPEHLAYINLFPTYATNEQLGNKGDVVTAYNEHLRQFIDQVKPALLSYDHYQFAVGADNPDYFLNLELVRRAAMEAGLPFLNIVQACTWTPSMREPGEGEMRFLNYTTLAYGAQGISYYVYSYPGHKPGITLADGAPTPVFSWLKALNREFTAIATQLQPLRSLGVWHAGMMPPGAKPLPTDAAFVFEPPISASNFTRNKKVTGALIGTFGAGAKDNSPPTHAVVVNLDYDKGTVLNVRGPGMLEIFDACSGRWSPAGGPVAELRLAGGGGALLRKRP